MQKGKEYMKKSTRIVSLLLAFIMMMGTMSVAASAYHSGYLDEDITDQYNSIDKVELELNQKASILLDQLDIMLVKEDIYIDIPLIGSIDLRSTDAALDSIYSLTGNWLFGDLTVGELGVLEDSRDLISTKRRSSTEYSDMEVIRSLVAYLAGCAEDGLLNIVDEDFNWGIIKGFLPPEFRVIIDDVPKFLKETLWELMHPVNEAAMPEGTTLDTLAQFALDNQIGAVEGGANAEALGFAGILPGFVVDLDEDNAYRVFDEAIFSVLNNVVVDILNNELKDTIVHAVEANTDDGGNLADLVNVNYTVTGYSYDRTQPLVSQLNDMFKGVVEQMLITGKSEWVSTADGATAGRSNVENLKYNLEVLLKQIIVAGGETENVSTYTLAQLGDYLTRVAVENYVTHLDFAQGDQMEKIAYLGVRELVIRLIPEVSYPDTPADTTMAGYRDAIIEMAADLGCYYLNANIGLDCPYSTSAAEFISAFINWCEPYINGLFDPTALNNVRNGENPDGWKEIDAIIWEFFPKEWMPYDKMFETTAGAANGTADMLTFKSLINYFIDAVFEMNIDKLYTFFTYKANSDLETMNADEFIIEFISNILNGAFSVGTTACVPDGITNFESLLDNSMAHTKTILKNILVALRDKTVTVAEYNKETQAYVNVTYKLDETVVNLVCMLLGFADPQSLSDVDMDMSGRVYCENGTVPSTNLRIYNHSNGVNSGWRNANGVLAQDKMYEIELISLTNTAGLTSSVTSGTKIAANSYLDVAVSGTIAATSEVRFDLTYYLLDEAGNRINNGTPLVKSIYSHFYTATGNYDLTSAEVTANNVTFDSFDTYLYTTDVYDVALFSIMATNNSGLLTSAANVSKAIVTGTLPTGISANVPTSGSIVALEDSSASSDTYGTVNPYVANIDNDAAQPYGIYDLDIQFEVKGTNILGSETSATTEARDHIIVVYDDFNLDGVLADVMDKNRQYSDYANADTEWAAYQNAVSAGYALLQGNPDHTKMFTDVNTDLEGTQNDYYTKVEAINAAVAALDAKAITDTAKLTALQTVVNTYKDVDPDDYVLFTYDRFEDAYDRAAGLVNSQVAPEGEEATFVAPALKAFDLVYAKAQLELWGGRLLKKAPVKTHLNNTLTVANEKVEADYTAASWATFKAARDAATTVNNDTSATLLQTTINDARIELLKAQYDLVTASVAPTTYITGIGSVVIDDTNNYILGVAANTANIATAIDVASGYTPYCNNTTTYIGTGTTVQIKNTENNVVAIYTVVVYGDVDGDGTVGELDSDIVANHIAEEALIDENTPEFIAADVVKDGVIDESDYDALY